MASDVSDTKAKTLQLIGIANELLAMARRFEQDDAGMQLMEFVAEHDLVDTPTEHRDHPVWTELAREHYRNRRQRDKIFATETLFGEPAWDILLDLFIAAKEGRRVSVMSACIGAAVPSTTALRWIAALERAGLLTRADDPDDARRTYVLLSPAGYAAMVDYFNAASRTLKPAVLARLNRMHDPLPEQIMPACNITDLGERQALRA